MSIPKKILILDTETTGIGHNTNYITQLSYVIFHLEPPYVYELSRQFLKLPPEVEISEEVTLLTGITTSMCTEKGVDPVEIMVDLYHRLGQVDLLVAHNQSFDVRFVAATFQRHKKEILQILGFPSASPPPSPSFPPLMTNSEEGSGTAEESSLTPPPPPKKKRRNSRGTSSSESSTPSPPGTEKIYIPLPGESEFLSRLTERVFCTMRSATKMCSLKDSAGRAKPPRLIELYTHLFPDEPAPTGLHDSLADVAVTLKCYMAAWHPDLFVECRPVLEEILQVGISVAKRTGREEDPPGEK